MLSAISNIFKYTLLVATILVFSHIIEIKGVTISQHVYNGMHSLTGYSVGMQANRITSDLSHNMQTRMNELKRVERDISSDDEHALNEVIQTSQVKKR